jgi:hypothetical protein
MRVAFLCVAAAGFFPALVSAQPPRPDPLENARTAQRIADQKADSEVRKALDDADRVAKVYPDKAIQILRSAQLSIDLGGSGMSTEKRNALTASIKGRLAALQGKPAIPAGKPDPAGPAVKSKRDAIAEAYTAEAKAVREGLDQIKRDLEANQAAAANKVIANLTAKYPNHPAVIALSRKDNLKQAVEDARVYSSMASDRVRIAMLGADKSAIPPRGDIDFPPDWTDKAGKRKDPNVVPLTDKEKRIIEALDKPVTIVGKDKPLEYLLQELSTTMDQPLLIDERSLKDLDIDLKRTGTLDARNVTARTALRQVLAAQGLTFVIKSETIQVVTVEKARDMLTTRVYYLGDVVQGVGPFGGGAAWGPFLDFQQTMANAQLIVDAIQDSVDPLSWKKRGGPATVTFHFPTMSLIVRASSEVHASLGSKFGSK